MGKMNRNKDMPRIHRSDQQFKVLFPTLSILTSR